MLKPTIEYIGFRTTAERREYFLRSRFGEEIHDYTVSIAQAAFNAGRARYQDGPEICYGKLQRALEGSGEAAIAADLTVTDADLAGYREAHTVPARRRFSADSAVAPRPLAAAVTEAASTSGRGAGRPG
jgi:hypothetical protein